MPDVVTFTQPGSVVVEECAAEPLRPGAVRVRTWYSGISAGTELTAYRGTNPYLTSTWDPDTRLFTDGEPTFAYPVRGWGYSEVGEIVEVAADVGGAGPPGTAAVAVGDVVYGIWGHRSEAVVDVANIRGRLTSETDPLIGCFARVGAIAYNALLASGLRLGESVAVFGQGVIGLLATRLCVLAGVAPHVVDTEPRRLDTARRFGARTAHLADVAGGPGVAIRTATGGGTDAAIELSGVAAALHEAIRSVREEGIVVASGFYQGGATDLRLGEEFHHNRVQIVASQISSTPPILGRRWNQGRLVSSFMELAIGGAIDVGSLVTDVVDVGEVASIFERLDAGDPTVLQAVLRFDAAPERA